MKNKASLVLMELLVMILVFALAAAVCLGIFVKSDEISRSTHLRDRAVVLAQNGAEVMKACAGEADTAADKLDGFVNGDVITVCREELVMTIAKVPSQIPGLGSGAVQVWQGDVCLFVLEFAWQEVAP